MRDSVYEIIAILSGEKVGDIEVALPQFYESITAAIASYSYVDLTYRFNLKVLDGISYYDRIVKNLDYLRKELNRRISG